MSRQEYARMLIDRGISPSNKKYSSVTPRGIYKLMPSMWRTAKQLENSYDFTFDRMMLDYDIATSKFKLDQLSKEKMK